MRTGLKMKRSVLIAAMDRAMDRLTDEAFASHGNVRPHLFIREPYSGTAAMLFMYGVLHPLDTNACMDIVYEELTKDGHQVCVVAADLTTLEINPE